MPTDFYYPYSFIRTPDREGVKTKNFVGDRNPSLHNNKEDHSRYWAGRYTGEIPVTLTTVTPLFITDPASKRPVNNQHDSYACLEEIPATALKGMLSSAYEIITNSRYRVFSEGQHGLHLGYRSEARASLVPGRVVQDGDDWYVDLYTGTSEIGEDGAAVPGDPLYAAWLPAYSGRGITEDAGCRRLEHGKRYDHVKIARYSHTGRMRFDFWSVKEIDGASLQKITTHANFTGEEQTVSGYVVKTGKIFQNKHDERFFFIASSNKKIRLKRLKLSKDVRKAYEELIADYVRTHEGGANQPNNRRYVLGEHTKKGSKLSKLKDGQFVHVKLDVDPAGMTDEEKYTVVGLYPVQISRELHKASPWDCLPTSLQPAEAIEQLSPADRLFGWVSQGEKGKGAWRGKVRISNARYAVEGKSPLEDFGGNNGKAMAILGSPKPAQARFYCGNDKGQPQQPGLDKDAAGYAKDAKDKRLRGRKVYLHHKNFSEQTVFPQGIERTNQNRSIRNWIPAGKEFQFKIRFENMTGEELGGLFLLLTQLEEKGCCFRLGYGKPLGLGSVTLKANIDDMEIFTGKDMQTRYSSLKVNEVPEDEAIKIKKIQMRQNLCKDLREQFERSIWEHYPDETDAQDSLLDGLLAAGQGVIGKIAYSVIDGKPNEPSFQWFVENDRPGRRHPLPQVGKSLSSYPKQERGGRRR